MSNLYQNFSSPSWGTQWGGGAYGGMPAASAMPAPAAPASPGFSATGVPSPPSFSLPGSSISTSPWSAFSGSNLSNIGAQTGAIIPQAESSALPYYTSGIGALQQYYGQAARPYRQLYQQAQPGVQAYMAAMGLGGPQAQQQSIADFLASPQVKAEQQLTTNALNAADAAAGRTGSGSAMVEAAQYADQLAKTAWPQYLQGFAPFLQQQQQAAQGAAGVLTGLGTGVSGGLNTIGGMMYGAPMTGLNYLTQADVAAQNAASANMAALTGLGSGLLSAGGLLGGAALLAPSDINVKENIEPVGKLADDQTVYRYNYRGDATPHIGLLAQEVEQITPEAVGEFAPGIKGVNYAVATDRAAKLMKFANDNASYDAPPMVQVYSSGLRELAA